jgi:hypothetical protein
MDSSRTVNIAFRVPNKEERAATIEYLKDVSSKGMRPVEAVRPLSRA